MPEQLTHVMAAPHDALTTLYSKQAGVSDKLAVLQRNLPGLLHPQAAALSTARVVGHAKLCALEWCIHTITKEALDSGNSAVWEAMAALCSDAQVRCAVAVQHLASAMCFALVRTFSNFA
jgi:hypothetical protein